MAEKARKKLLSPLEGEIKEVRLRRSRKRFNEGTNKSN
jgi:hypothetical protein